MHAIAEAGTFDVSVKLLVSVQIFQAHEKLSDDDSDVFLWYQTWL